MAEKVGEVKDLKVGSYVMIDGEPCKGLGDQLCLGIGVLHRAGYKFSGINSTPDGQYEKVCECCPGNESVLAELIQGTFDGLGRARETLAFNCGDLDWDWLADVVSAEENTEVD